MSTPCSTSGNPLAVAVLLLQRCFWVGTTDNPVLTTATNMPSDLFARGGIALVLCRCCW